MRKIITSIMMIAVAGSILLTGCSLSKQTSGKEDDSWKRIKEKGEFVVGLDDAFPPMGFRDNSGELVGFDIDMAKEAAKRMGVEVKFQPIDWKAVTMELKNRNVDLAWNGMTITDTRKKEIDFTKPYIEQKQILIVQKNSAIKGKADLKGKNVGIQAGSSSKVALEKDTKVAESIKEVVEFPDNEKAMMALKLNKIDAVIIDEVVGRYIVSKDKDSFVVLEDDFGKEDFGVGARKGDTAFLNELQKALDEMKKDGTSKRISEKWFAEDIVK